MIGDGWNDFVQVFGGGSGAICAVTRTGDLKWYRHLDPLNGSNSWGSGCCGKVIGDGWRFQKVGSGGGGVIYGVGFDGLLYWYKHLDPLNGGATWASNQGILVGRGWLDTT